MSAKQGILLAQGNHLIDVFFFFIPVQEYIRSKKLIKLLKHIGIEVFIFFIVFKMLIFKCYCMCFGDFQRRK